MSNVCPFDCTDVAGNWKVRPVNLFTEPVTRTDRPMSVRNRWNVLKFYGRYGEFIKHYEVSFSQILHDILGHDHIQ